MNCDDQITLSKKQAKELLEEIASMCEKAYRRGAQQAVAAELTESDAEWFRHYGTIERKDGIGFFTTSHALPEAHTEELPDGSTRTVPPKEYSRRRPRSALEILRTELPYNDAHEYMNKLFWLVERERE